MSEARPPLLTCGTAWARRPCLARNSPSPSASRSANKPRICSQLNRRMGYFQMRMLAKAFVAAAKSGDFSAMEEAVSQPIRPGIVQGPARGPGIRSRLVRENENAAALPRIPDHPPPSAKPPPSNSASLTENLGMLGEMVEPVEVEKAGRKFAGQKISGAKLSASMAEEREEMEEMLEPAAVDKLLAAVAKKDLVVAQRNARRLRHPVHRLLGGRPELRRRHQPNRWWHPTPSRSAMPTPPRNSPP